MSSYYPYYVSFADSTQQLYRMKVLIKMNISIMCTGLRDPMQ